MSAFIVSEDHIDFMVTAAIDLSTGHGSYALYWQQHPGPNGRVRVDLGIADEFGAMLLAENIASVQYRYRNTWEDTPDPELYRYRRFALPYGDNWHEAGPIAQVMKAISCYEYQSCEHPGWNESEAKRICDHLRAAYINRLPGYEDAEWEVRRPEMAVR